MTGPRYPNRPPFVPHGRGRPPVSPPLKPVTPEDAGSIRTPEDGGAVTTRKA